MSTFVYFTENCRSDTITHGIMEDVERLKQRIENTHSTSMFDPFPAPYLVKKKFGKYQCRLIAELRTVEDHAVIIFLAVLIRGGHDYKSFSDNPNNYGQQHFNHLVSDEEITKFVEESTREPETLPKCEPSDGECGLLYGAFAIHKNSATEDLVCETHRWVEQVTEERIKKQLVLLCNPCLKALSKAHGLHFVHVPDKPNWGIWVLRSEKRLLLITLVTDANADEAKNFAENIRTQLEGKDTMTVLRFSRRAYPAIVLADDDLWIDLESETVANMALSPEESEVLESARGTDNPFPLFINGRAGSGKSTILQYLFADLLYYFLNRQGEIQEPPLYLTANGELLRMARSFVERLLSSEATFNEDSTPSRNLVNGNREILGKAFCEFQPHLLSLLSPEERSQYFAHNARVDYARFRRMWLDHFKRDNREVCKLGPDLSWHVIRSYIKGMSSETELDPDDYIELPENQITVTHEAYKLVYKDVWLGWYQNILKEGLWDDQDLTRYILENDLAKPLYPVIFCDEAQDFTRLELELLLRLNLFSNRTLQPNAISRVPFAFAGDQFQTLNPTGFRWESIKAAFVEKFIFELDIARRSGRTDLNYRELKYNYRSTRPIVRFGNHVQAMRAALFQLPDLKPQIPWAIESSSFPVVWFRANDAEFWKKFRENQGFVVIIPCNEGEEADFVRDDPNLRQHVQIVDGVPQNVLSAGRAKGCEYPAVIVYGFGNAAETDIVSQLESPLNKEQSLDPDRSLPLQYFINRLYVAVSRPKHRLVVVDTDEGFQKLWKCAQEQASESLMLKNVKKGRDVWEDEIEGMTLGNPEDLTRESISNSLENARVFEADGKARRDSFLLKQAVQAYRSAGDEAKAKECRAYAFEADGNFLEAGNAFFDAGFATKGVHCLWRAEKPGWIHLRDKIEPFPQVAQEIEYEFASVILGKIDPAKVTSLLDRFDKRLEGDNKFAESCIGENIWRVALIELLKPLNGQKQYSSWEQMASSLTHIRAKGVRVSPSAACAWIFYSANRLEEAIAFWDEAGETKSNDYLKAKASVEPYPQRILSLSRLGLFEDIIRAWSDAPNSPLSPDQRTALADALREVNRLEDAFVCAWEDGNTSFADSMLRIALSAFNNGDTAMATKALHASVILLVRQAKWDMVNTFISSNEFIPTIEWKGKKIKDWVTSETKAMRVNLIRALARSDKLPNADTKFLQKLTKFFQDFLKEKDKWRNKITIFEAGAAMERAGRFVDAIMFYETYAKDSYKEEGIKQFARQRWSVCKKRQLDWETNHSKSSPQKLRGIEDELRQKRADWQISPQTVLKTYPELDPITLGTEGTGVIAKSDPIALTHEYQVPPTPSSEVEELPEKTVIAVNDFEIELSRKLQRCNIKHRISMETAFVKINERKFGGEVDFIQIDELHWRCEVWKINVFFQDISQGVLVIDMEKLGAEIKLTLLHLKK